MGDFVVREWLAERLGREPDQLDLVGAARVTARGQEGRYDIDGGEMAVVLITWVIPDEHGPGRRTVIATLPDGGALHDIDGDERIVW